MRKTGWTAEEKILFLHSLAAKPNYTEFPTGALTLTGYFVENHQTADASKFGFSVMPKRLPKGSRTRQHNIRLIVIDAPEKNKFSAMSPRHCLADMVASQTVVIEWLKVNKYGRELGKVLPAGLNCKLEQVKRGLAWHYKQYQRERSLANQRSYAAAEIEARAAKLCL